MLAPSDEKPIGQKAPLCLLPLDPLGAVSGAMEYGIASGRTAWNWIERGADNERRMEEYVSAALRHTLAIIDPSKDEFDDDSGIHHAAHACASLLIYLHKRGISYTSRKEPKHDNVTSTPPPQFDSLLY